MWRQLPVCAQLDLGLRRFRAPTVEISWCYRTLSTSRRRSVHMLVLLVRSDAKTMEE
jgi:hypothetical protein